MPEVVRFDALEGDPRLTPAAAVAEPRRMIVQAATAPLRTAPDAAAPLDSVLLYGEEFVLLESRDGWARGQSAADGYVGYVPEATLGAAGPEPTHRIAVPMTHAYEGPTIKAEPVGALFFGSRVAMVAEGERLSELENGLFVPTAHLAACETTAPDICDTALMFLHAPYLWGGRSVQGIDCSGLVQIAVQAAGLPCPRDSDMQEAALGVPVSCEIPRRKGDIIFWKGHVGLMVGELHLLHANQHAMRVTIERFDEAQKRISESQGLEITSVRRLNS